MPITKTADAFLGAITGGVRASNLSDKERKALIEEYNLPEEASLGWRNAGRGAVGGALGWGGGSLLGSALAKGRNPAAGLASGLAGSILGMKAMTDKYSRGEAQELLKD